MLTATGPGVGQRRPDRGCEDIEVDTHYGQKGEVDYQVDWQPSWFVGSFARLAHRRDGLDGYDEYSAMDGGFHAIEPEIWPC